MRHVGPEAAKGYPRRLKEGFFDKYLSGKYVLDIGFQGGDPESVPITDSAIGVGLSYPGYDGRTLPFADDSQDAVFVSHCLEHIDDYKVVLADWYRVLKVGGFLIVAVPHQHLYERKAALPSWFNGDHRRFYTPASLLAEVEEALPVAGYRIRVLRDVDEGFDYSIPPERPPLGSYEIELVIEKIAIPAYAPRLRMSEPVKRTLEFYAEMVARAIAARRAGDDRALLEVHQILLTLPLPPLKQIAQRVQQAAEFAPPGLRVAESELLDILQPMVRAAPFDDAWYAAHNRGVSGDVHAHYLVHGYREGRQARAEGSIFD